MIGIRITIFFSRFVKKFPNKIQHLISYDLLNLKVRYSVSCLFLLTNQGRFFDGKRKYKVAISITKNYLSNLHSNIYPPFASNLYTHLLLFFVYYLCFQFVYLHCTSNLYAYLLLLISISNWYNFNNIHL